MELINVSPFAAKHLVTNDGYGRETLLVVVKATYLVTDKAKFAPQQADIVVADVYHGAPGASSIKSTGDLSLFKPRAEVIVSGCAYPRQSHDRSVDAVLRVAGIEKRLQIFGDRVWQKTPFGYRPSDPLPFDKIPVVYERCFGGADESRADHPQYCAFNPVGCGFAGKSTSLQFAGRPVPNVVSPHASLQAPTADAQPACFAAIAPHWLPRVAHTGTYDAAWQKQVMPLLPNDFDPQYYQTAPQDQILASYIHGGEVVCLENMTASHLLEFEIPKTKPLISVNLGDDLLDVTANCDTLQIDCEQRQFTLVWRARVDVHERLRELFWICVEDCEAAYVES